MKYKKLIVSGCSFTERPNSWAEILASVLNLELINLASGGAGNKHVQYSLLNYIAKNDLDPNTTLVGIMWSHPIREDLFFEMNPEFKHQELYLYKFDDYTAEISTRDLLKSSGFDDRKKRAFVAKHTILSGNGNKAGIALDTWTTMESTISFLKANGFDFFQTIFHDYLHKSDLLSTKDEAWEFQKQFFYANELERINLKLNKNGWLDLNHDEFLGEFAFFKKELESDEYHPNQIAHRLWTVKILLPKLVKMGYIDKFDTLSRITKNLK